MAATTAKKAKKKRRSYRGYYTELDGKIYGVAQVRQPDGSYKRKLKVCKNKTDARKWALGYIATHKENTTFNPNLNFQQLAAWYAKEYLHPPIMENGLKVSGVKDYKRSKNKLKVFAEFFGEIKVTEFSESDLRRWQTARRKEKPEITQTTLNRDFELLRVIFRAGARNRKIKEAPVFDIINNSAEVERDRVLSFEEEKRLLDACVDVETVTFKRGGKEMAMNVKANRGYLRPLIIMAVDTAMRANEIITLKWEKVDLTNRIILIEAQFSKTQRARKVPISDRLFVELEKMDKTTKKVFDTSKRPRSFDTACLRAKIFDLTFHDLRHTAITRMINAGIPYGEVMKISGHSEIKTFLKYLNPTDHSISGVAKHFSQYLEKNLG
jgi:integrase